ncbi:MAG TPA: efflux RND transporter periplasmic adaptor subunit, partial [Thermoanaerobaculia bacterium]|nr:efflux RND transporter periplasmic adaptor subunit [Thermoanaerobaculia bacterium]
IGSIAQPVELVGTITAQREAAVSSKISGQITQMALLENRTVRRGDLLAQVEARDVAAQRAEAAAAVTTARDAIAPAETALETSRRTYERRQGLYAKGGISKKDLEASQLDVANAAGALKTANSKVAEAMSHLASLDAQLGYSAVRAPFDGVVTDQFAYQGDFATSGTKLLTVADTSTVIVKAPLSAEAATRVHAGDVAAVAPDDLPGVTLQARVSLVGRSADAQSRAVEIWVTLANPEGRLRPNAAARVTIGSNATANAVIVPTPAVTLDATNANGGTVMVVDAQSVAHEIHVSVGAHDNQRTQITSGLQGGETVVVEGNYGLPDKTKVAVAR